MNYTERTVLRNQYYIYARDYPGEDPPIILMHGFPDNLHLYDLLVPHLSSRHVITFDFLGWGASDKPAGHPYTAKNQEGDLDAVITQQKLQRVVWRMTLRVHPPLTGRLRIPSASRVVFC